MDKIWIANIYMRSQVDDDDGQLTSLVESTVPHQTYINQLILVRYGIPKTGPFWNKAVLVYRAVFVFWLVPHPFWQINSANIITFLKFRRLQKYNNEPVHTKRYKLAYATSVASDQPAHSRSLTRSYTVRWIEDNGHFHL